MNVDLMSLAPLGFGCAQLFRLQSSQERRNVLAAAYDAGIRHFDVAPLYGLGEAEAELGRFLQGKREAVTVTTKFGLEPAAAASAMRSVQGLARRLVAALPPVKRLLQRRKRPMAGRQAFDARVAERSLERSLRLLRVEHVDYFLLHEPTAELVERDRPLEFLQQQQHRGRIGSFGVAGPSHNVAAVIHLNPALAAVIQHPAPQLGKPPIQLAQPAEGSSFIYGSVAPRLADITVTLATNAAAGDTWLERFGGDWDRRENGLARLLLLEQQLNSPRSTVLFGTTNPAHITEMTQPCSHTEREHIAWIRSWAAHLSGGRLTT